MNGGSLAVRGRRDRLADNVAGIATIARLSLLEAIRRRLLWALAGLTALLVVVTAWAFQRVLEASPLSPDETRFAVSQLLILVAFMFSFVLAMTAVFVGSPAIAGQLESGEALAVLARPIRRADVVLGRWVGFGIVVVAYAILAGLGEIGAVAVTTGYLPPQPLLAAGYVGLEGLVLLTLAVALSTRLGVITAGAIAVVLFGINWVMGVVGQAGAILGNDAIRTAGSISRLVMPTDVAWRGAIASLEPSAAVLSSLGRTGAIFAVNPFYAAAQPSLDQLAYAGAWIVAGLAVAIVLFSRREL
jgi:ABC-type transport system involved in multi-copper enzyme maturation permease subunit